MFFRSVIILFVVFISANIQAQSDSALTSLSNKLMEIKTFKASFIQYSIDQKGRRLQESKGDLKAKRGGLFFWHTYEPLEQIVSSNGVEVTVYDPDIEQATIQRISDQVSATPAILFSGEVSKIGDNFEVEHEKSDNVDLYTLKPRGDQGLFEKLKVKFAGSSLTTLTFTDALGQKNTMSFIQTQINPDISEADFELKLPDSVDVIRENMVH